MREGTGVDISDLSISTSSTRGTSSTLSLQFPNFTEDILYLFHDQWIDVIQHNDGTKRKEAKPTLRTAKGHSEAA